MMHDDYSGLSRAYSTAPDRAIRDLSDRIHELHSTVDVASAALKHHAAMGTESIETVLSRASRELWELQQETEYLLKQLEGGADDE